MPWVALARGLGALGAVLTFLVSAPLLDGAGLGYSVPGGSPLTKIHPATFAAAAGVGAASLAYGNPLAGLGALARRYPGLAFFALTWASLVLYNGLVQGIPAAVTVDTFVLPMALLALFGDAPPAGRRRLGLVLHAIMAANAGIALVEFATGWRLVPLTIGATELTWDWRPSALLGHPLSNAATTATYLLVLVLGGGSGPTGLPGPVRLALAGLQGGALVVFGGRVALVVALAVLAGRGLLLGLALLRGRRVGLLPAAAAALIVPPALGVVALVLARGALDPIIGRFVDDSGSAAARAVLLGFFDHLTTEDVLLGSNQDLIHYLQYVEGTEFGIENFWISFVLSYGALISAVFFLGLLAFFAELVRATGRAGLAVVLANLVVASSSLSYGAKTLMLAQMTALMLVLLPRRGEGS